MNPAKLWNSYRQVATQTAPPGQLVLMLYEGAIRFLDRALAGFLHEDPREFNETIHNNIQKAQNIIRELSNSLDRSAGELADQLSRLYEYMDRRLMESNVRKEVDGIKEVVVRLTIVRDAWATMLQSQHTSPIDDGRAHFVPSFL